MVRLMTAMLMAVPAAWNMHATEGVVALRRKEGGQRTRILEDPLTEVSSETMMTYIPGDIADVSRLVEEEPTLIFFAVTRVPFMETALTSPLPERSSLNETFTGIPA